MATEQISPGRPFLDALRQTGQWSGELLHRTRDGRRIFVHSRQRVIAGHQGQPLVLESNEDITARRAAQEALRESEERFRATFEQAAVGLAHVGLKGEWLRVNQRLCEIVGYSQEELLKLTFADITYPSDLEADWAQANALLRGDIQTYSLEKRYIRKDGTLVWINLTVALLRDQAGLPRYFISVVEDISSRKRTEAELQESERRFRLLFKLSPVPKYLIDPADHSVVAANQRAAEQLGYTHSELLQLRVPDFDIGQSPHEIHSHVKANLQGRRLTFETRHRTKTGESRDVIVTSDAVVLEGRTLIYASVLDITERKQAKRQIRELATTLEQRVEERTRELDQQRSFLQALLDTVDVGIVSCDAEGRLTLFNRTSREWHGIPADSQVLAPQLSDHYRLYETDGETPLRTECIPLLWALRGELVQDAEMVIASRDGLKRRIQSSARQLRNHLGQVVGAVAAMHDITSQKQAEAELKYANLKLQEANRELEAFSYSVSHDLRAPLRSIEGYSNVLFRDYASQLDTRAQELFARIRANSVRMGQIIESLLNLSRVSRAPLRRETVDLTAMAQRISQELHNSQPDRAASVEIQNGVVAFADPKLVRTVLENLIGNAWKFTRHASPAHIQIGQKLQDGKAVYYVQDNGVGFDKSYYNQLFTAFQRLHRAQEFDGFGFGLTTVARIIHKHGGLVWAESAPGQGATFFFTLE